MTRDEEFISRWRDEKAAYLAWGQHISSVVEAALATRIAPTPTSYFLKTAPVPRTKDDLKLLEKAFYRNKNYRSPYEDITDKVGTRFVVLLGRDIQTVVEALESVQGWTLSKDRDYEEEQKRNPIEFSYAAVHFIVRPDEDVQVGDVLVSAGTPCEVQIKTILQHAYSELTHDTIYKPQIQATPAMQRNAAKAMALLEATNDYFEKVADEVNTALSSVRAITGNLSTVYYDLIGMHPSPTQLEGLLLEAYESSAGEDYGARVRSMIGEKPFLVDRIKEHIAERNPLFTQPSILLAYLDIARRGQRALQNWPLTPTEMEPLLNDLGQSRY